MQDLERALSADERVHERLWNTGSIAILTADPPQVKDPKVLAEEKYKNVELAHAHLIEVQLKTNKIVKELNVTKMMRKPLDILLLRI